MVRLSAAITKSEGFQFLNNISNYSVLSSSGESLTGSVITSSVAQYNFNKHNTCGSFTTDTNGYGYVFSLFHSVDPVSTIMHSGNSYGQRLYSGSEALVINFNSALAANCNIDIYGSVTSMLKQSHLGFTKIIV